MFALRARARAVSTVRSTLSTHRVHDELRVAPSGKSTYMLSVEQMKRTHGAPYLLYEARNKYSSALRLWCGLGI